MQEFIDKQGQKWSIDLTIGTVERIRKETSGRFDLWSSAGTLDGRPIQQVLWDDLPIFWELLWKLIEPSAEERGIPAADFGELMAADCLLAAQDAFFMEWADFFRAVRRPEQAEAIRRTERYRKQALDKVKELLTTDAELAELDQQVTRKLDAEIEASRSVLRASLESILGPGPGVN